VDYRLAPDGRLLVTGKELLCVEAGKRTRQLRDRFRPTTAISPSSPGQAAPRHRDAWDQRPSESMAGDRQRPPGRNAQLSCGNRFAVRGSPSGPRTEAMSQACSYRRSRRRNRIRPSSAGR
jgi:hypothetical protein